MAPLSFLTGTGVALVTPFHKDGSIDFKSLQTLVNHQIKGKTEYLVVLGTTGESVTLSKDEKKAVAGFVVEAADGKIRKIQAAQTEHILRLIQSIPSPKAEPFKQWLAQVGAERIAEIENPELAQARIRATYKAKGYSDAWIEKRIRGIQTRDELTNEWKNRGVKEGKEYSILTAEISKATFGIIPSEYKSLKGLTKTSENLRDHMTDLELIFTMLGEASTTEIAKNKNAQGFIENHKAAKAGGNVAGNARKELEKKSGAKIVNKQNFKNLDISKELKDNNDL
jgi:hypothetical protein